MTTNFWDGYTFEVDKQDQVYQSDIHSLSLNAPNLKSKVMPADVDFIQPNLPPADMASLFSQMTAAAANVQFVDAMYQPGQPNMIKLNESKAVKESLPSKVQELTVHDIVDHLVDALASEDIISRIHTFKKDGDKVTNLEDGLHIDCNDGYGSTFTITVVPY